MKLVHFSALCVALAACIASTSAAKCSDHLLQLKANDWNDDEYSSKFDSNACTASFSSFHKHLGQFHGLINEHITQSFLYSVMASHFQTDAENRLGFKKYLHSLGDTMWKDAIDMIKYAGKRGADVAPKGDDANTGLRMNDLNTDVIKPWTELEALALALDKHHALGTQVHQLHSSTKDPAFADFLESQFAQQHVDRIRQLSGHLSILAPMVQEESGADLALYLFDQSLA